MDAVIHLQSTHAVLNEWIILKCEPQRLVNRSWPNLRLYTRVCLEGFSMVTSHSGQSVSQLLSTKALQLTSCCVPQWEKEENAIYQIVRNYTIIYVEDLHVLYT
jgi:hypothetical protein